MKAQAVKTKAAQSVARTSRTASRPARELRLPRRPRTRTAPRPTPQERDSPLLDLSDAAVKRLFKTAQGARLRHLRRAQRRAAVRGGVLRDRSRTPCRCCPTWASTSSRARRRGGRARRAPRSADDEEPPRRAPRRRCRPTADTRRADRPHRRSGAHVPARDGLGRAAVARGRNRHRQAHRGRPRGDDRRPVRKPADLPGHHHLARRAERRPRFCCATSSISKPPTRAPRPRPRRRRCRVRRDGARLRRRRPQRRQWPKSGGRRRAASRRRDGRRGRLRERAVARGHGSRAQAEGARDLRPHRRRPTRSCASCRTRSVEHAGGERAAHAPAAEGLRQAARRDHRRRQEPLAQQQPHREPGRAALRHQQDAGRRWKAG